MYFLVLDIETSGPLHTRDEMFAIGLAFGTETSIITTAKFISLQPSSDWREDWERRGWNMQTYESFWSKYEYVLNDLAAAKNCNNAYDIMEKLDEYLDFIERRYGDFTVCFDTMNYDSVWLNVLLQKYGFQDLARNRDGSGYRSSLEIDSYFAGKLGVAPNSDEYRARKNAMNLAKEGDAHDPEVDARNMMIELIAALSL